MLRQEAFPPSVHQELLKQLTSHSGEPRGYGASATPTPALLRHSLLLTLQAQSHAHTPPGLHPCGSLSRTQLHTLPPDQQCDLGTWLPLVPRFGSFSSPHSTVCLELHCQSSAISISIAMSLYIYVHAHAPIYT